ncbi:MAG: hypothetical protein AB7L09_01230 [Nitrospira sp.]
MTPEAYAQELKRRGFTYNSSCDRWVGPFNIQVPGYLNGQSEVRGPERDVGNQYARAATISQVDEQLRARRGLPRVPLVEPTNPYSTQWSPYVQIPDPGTSPPVPSYPPHQKNLPPDGRRID